VPPIRVWVLRDPRPLIAYNFNYYVSGGIKSSLPVAPLRCARRLEGPLWGELLSGNPRQASGIGATPPLAHQTWRAGIHPWRHWPNRDL